MYIGVNNGGFTTASIPAAGMKPGSFGRSQDNFNPTNVARGGSSPGSPQKTNNYHTNGSGRDTYIATNHGGFVSNYSPKQNYDAYVDNLRGYQSNSRSLMRDICHKSSRQGKLSPKKDFFIEGQVNNTSRRVRNGLAVLKQHQRGQCARLAIPRKKSNE